MIIEPATAADLDAICEIEQHSFPTPWPRATFEAELARDIGRLVVVRERPGAAAIAFCNYWIVAPPREARNDDRKRAEGELHVLAVATHPDRRRRGIAGLLVAHALDDARRADCRIATLEVRRGNIPAIALYERAGFATVHVRAAYYQDNGEDALVMICDLSGSARRS